MPNIPLRLITLITIAVVVAVVFIVGTWISPILAVALVVGYHYRKTLTQPQYALVIGLLLGALVAYGGRTAFIMRSNIANPPEWDFIAYWLGGKTLVSGQSIYESEPFYEFADTIDVELSEEFTHEILDVGLYYPPPTAFMILPLGFFDLHTAYLVWYIVQTLVIGGIIYLLWRVFLPQSGWEGLVFSAAMLLMLRSTAHTLAIGQTNFFILLMVMLYFRMRPRAISGVWLAIATFVKPYVAGLGLYLLLKRRFSIIGATVATALVIALASILVFGLDMFTNYFTNPPIGRAPAGVYTEPVNQSLLATTLRLTGYDYGDKSPVMYPVFLVIAAAVGLITVFLIWRLTEKDDDLAFLLNLIMLLLIYPATLMHYSVLLLPPLFWFWSQRERLPGKIIGYAIFVGVLYAVLEYGYGDMAFVANLLMWLALSATAVQRVFMPGAQVQAST
jgi:hypothetical protein